MYLQHVETVPVLYPFPRLEEILVEDVPPMAVISLARAERDATVKQFVEDGPDKALYTRRRLRNTDKWWIEVRHAKPRATGRVFYTTLVVQMAQIRKDMYAVSKVQPYFPFQCIVFKNAGNHIRSKDLSQHVARYINHDDFDQYVSMKFLLLNIYVYGI